MKEKIDFDKLDNELYMGSATEIAEIEKEIDEQNNCEKNKQMAFNFKVEVEELKNHFLKFVPEGYTREEIENMNDDEILALKAVYESHCF